MDKLVGIFPICFRRDKFTDTHNLSHFVRNFYSQSSLAGYRSGDPYRLRLQAQGKIIGQSNDFVDLDARGRSVLIGGDNRTGRNSHDLAGYAEIFQFLFQLLGDLVIDFIIDLFLNLISLVEKR